MRKPLLLLGHRGARRYAAENSLEAFRLALSHGCDGFEFDLRLSRDRQPVICHDAEYAGVKIAHAPAQQIYARLHFPTLSEILAEFASRAFLNIEIKVTGAEQTVLASLEKHGPQRGCVISSFLPEVVEALNGYHSSWPLGFVCQSQSQLSAWHSLPVQALMLHCQLATPELVQQAQRAGKQVFVWAVNEDIAMRDIAGYGVDGLISDDTLLLAKTLAAARALSRGPD